MPLEARGVSCAWRRDVYSDRDEVVESRLRVWVRTLNVFRYFAGWMVPRFLNARVNMWRVPER